jgi:hypothetical protein
MTCVSYHRNGQRDYIARFATTFTSLSLRGRVFVSARTTATSMGNVKIASSPGTLRRREAAGGHSISRFFRRFSPFPFAGLPVVAGDTALDHFVAPFVAYHDERGEITAAKAKRAKSYHDDELQQLTHHSVSHQPTNHGGGKRRSGIIVCTTQ